MTELSHLRVLLAGHGAPAARARADALERAGAFVRVASPDVDLWSSLADAPWDALIVFPGEGRTSFEALVPLRSDARTKRLPCIAVVAPTALLSAAELASLSPLYLVSSECDDAAFVEKTAEATEANRRQLEAEERGRAMQVLLEKETARAEGLATHFAELSHDLRAILGIVYGFSCNLRDEVAGPLTDAQRVHVRRILDAVESATALLETARTVRLAPPRSKPVGVAPSNRPERAQRSLVSLATVGEEAVGLLQTVADERRIRLALSCDPSVSVWGDALKLKQVVLNLVGNALKYTPEGGAVKVAIHWSSPSSAPGSLARRTAQLVVTDTGPGVPSEWRKRIFERGVRIHPEGETTGEGIGLFLVREAVLQHGGGVRVEDAPEGGAVFSVSLPADRRERASDARPLSASGRPVDIDIAVSELDP